MVSRVYSRPFELVLTQIGVCIIQSLKRKQHEILGVTLMVGRVRIELQNKQHEEREYGISDRN